MPKVAVLGGGMVGGFIARTMACDSGTDVLLVDRDANCLAACQPAGGAGVVPLLSTMQADLSDADVVRSVIEEADLVVGAVPGHMGYFVLQTVLGAGKNCVDISFFPEDALSLDGLARQRGASALVDCGVMPGLGGMLGARMAADLEAAGADVTHLRIMVGGLPLLRRWPLEYKAPFSPVDVLEEYTRPARLREWGREVEYSALSGVELVDLPGVGMLEAFNTDGLRTLLTTLTIPNMTEKTLRYPGHADKMRLLRDLGFFRSTTLTLRGGREVTPLEVTSKLLDGVWRLDAGEQEFTVMRVEVQGNIGGQQLVRCCDLLDRTDPVTGDSSMARTTGWPAILAARLYLGGGWTRPGVAPAELVGLDASAWQFMQAGLAKAGIELKYSPDVAAAQA
ncbi:MAG: saccharopine dehydrogenase NADP-binding domain-containing protein [bacterium]|nr:saccharopine dehydrogenase NADP-binding domain-containing protein [bacterium]